MHIRSRRYRNGVPWSVPSKAGRYHRHTAGKKGRGKKTSSVKWSKTAAFCAHISQAFFFSTKSSENWNCIHPVVSRTSCYLCPLAVHVSMRWIYLSFGISNHNEPGNGGPTVRFFFPFLFGPQKSVAVLLGMSQHDWLHLALPLHFANPRCWICVLPTTFYYLQNHMLKQFHSYMIWPLCCRKLVWHSMRARR